MSTPLAKLLARLPRIGEATAQRLAAAIASQPEQYREALARAVVDERTPGRCQRCGDEPEGPRCRCEDETIDGRTILVVQTSAARRHVCRVWTGQCHVLGPGPLSSESALPWTMALLERCRDPRVTDVVLALGQSEEARELEAALASLLRGAGLAAWGLARGVRWGQALEDQDVQAVALALTERRPLV